MGDRRKDAVVVVGLGRFGGALALELVREGTEVLAIDSRRDIVQPGGVGRGDEQRALLLLDQLTHGGIVPCRDAQRTCGWRATDRPPRVPAARAGFR